MPRQVRTTSAISVYHAILRGVNKQHGPRALSRLTGVPCSIVQRATSGSFLCNEVVCEPLPDDDDFETYKTVQNMRNLQNINIRYGSLHTCPYDPSY